MINIIELENKFDELFSDKDVESKFWDWMHSKYKLNLTPCGEELEKVKEELVLEKGGVVSLLGECKKLKDENKVLYKALNDGTYRIRDLENELMRLKKDLREERRSFFRLTHEKQNSLYRTLFVIEQEFVRLKKEINKL